MSHRDQIIITSKNKASPIFIFSLFILVANIGAVSAFHGQEISLKLKDAFFTPVPGASVYQIKVLVDYSVSNSSFIGKKINAIMKVYSGNGTILKTTSFPAGFTLSRNGTQQLLTKIAVPSVDNVTTVTTFTDLKKMITLSNPVKTLPTLQLH